MSARIGRTVPPSLPDRATAPAPDAGAPTSRSMLSLPATLALTVGLGAAVGMLLLRPRGVGGAGALLRGLRNGALVGAGTGVALLGLDRLTGGQVQHQLDLAFLNRLSQIGFVLRHPTKPWLGPTTLAAAGDARDAQHRHYGSHDPRDGAPDAFRHAYGAALLALRMMREHGLEEAEARRLAHEAGEAHEADGQDNTPMAYQMDLANNTAGLEVLGDGHAADGSWISEQALQRGVLEAMANGCMLVIDAAAGATALRTTTVADLPAHG